MPLSVLFVPLSVQYAGTCTVIMAEFLSYNVKITRFSRDPGKKCSSSCHPKLSSALELRSMALGRTFLPGSLEKPDNFVPLASTGFSSQGRSMLRAFGKTRNLELENPVHRIWLQFARSNWWGIHGFD